MRGLVRRTWLPTLLFGMAILLIESTFHDQTMPPIGLFTLLTLVVVPPVWSRTIPPRGHTAVLGGVAAGAACGAAIALLPLTLAALSIIKDIVFAGMDKIGISAMMALVGFAIAFGLLITVGASVGILTVILKKALDALTKTRAQGEQL
jgi:hypothetical protein